SCIDEYQPKGPTETDLVHDLADTGWRLKRIPLLEAALLNCADIADPHHALATLSLHDTRLWRKYHKTVSLLRELQSERRQTERHELKRACGLLEMQKYKGLPWEPAEDGFVFSKEQLEAHSQLLMRHREALRYEYVYFDMDPGFRQAALNQSPATVGH